MDTIISALLVVSVLTSLTVQGIKKVLEESKIQYSANVLAIVISAVLSMCVSGGYLIYEDKALTPKIFVEIIALIYLSFLSATVSFDKVKQALLQLKSIQ